MALNLGELVAKLRLDAREWKASNKEAEATFRGLTAKLGALAAVAGVAVAAAFGATLLKGMDEWDLGAKIASQFGGGQDEAAAYGSQIGRIYADNFGESIDQVAEALTAVMRSAKDLVPSGSPAEIDKITKSALTLNQVFGYETSASVRAVQQMIRNGLVPDAQAGFDLIASAASKGVDKSEDLLDTFNEYSTMFRDLGINGEQALGLISQGLRAGARDADTVADALKEFAIRAQDGSTASAAGYKMLGLDAQKYTRMAAKGGDAAAHALEIVLLKLRNTTDPFKRNAAAVALFGTKAEDLGDALFALDMDKASGEMAGFSGTVEGMANTLAGTPKQKIQAFWRGLQQGATDVITAKVLPAISSLIDWVTGSLVPALQAAGGWIDRNRSWLGLLASMLGGAALAIGVITGAIRLWAMATTAYTAVQWLLNAAMDANPIGIVIVAIAALVAGVVYAYTHFEGFRKVVDSVWSGIKTAVSAVVGWITGTAWPFLQRAWAGIAAGAMWLWHNAIQPVADGIGTAIRFVAGIVMWLVGVVRTVGTGIGVVFAFVMRIVTSVANLFIWLGQKIIGPIVGFIVGYFKFLASIIAWFYQNAVLPVFGAIGTAVKFLGGVFAWLYEYGIKTPFNWIVSAFVWVWAKVSPIFEKIKTAVGKVGSTFKSIFSAIAGYIRGAFNGAIDIAKGAINSIIGLVNGAIGFINRNMIDGLNHVPGVDFPHIPTLPKLAKGGAVHPSPGGTPVIMGDGGEIEYGIPRSDLESIIKRAVSATGGGGIGGGALELTLVLHDTAQNRITRRTARVQGNSATVLVGKV
jgi:phage-related minor tail protein